MEFNEKLHRRIRWPAVLHILLPLLAAFTALMGCGAADFRHALAE